MKRTALLRPTAVFLSRYSWRLLLVYFFYNTIRLIQNRNNFTVMINVVECDSSTFPILEP